MNRIKVKKIGLLNFWLYDEEEFDFYGGNLILRGTNGSGKSVTMQSFIPLILDGNKSPDRLDPFGSKERKIEDYILGDSESIQKEEAISYLYMECFNEEDKNYITVGLGFKGRKGKPVESWGFALKDGARVNHNFYLYKDKTNKIPLTKNELKSRLGTVNEFCDTMKDYKKMVNRLLFGFPNTETYDEFIKLLLQLRSNKLSKDYKPTNLINVLNTVLEPLSEEDLRPLSEAISEMNKTKEQVENLEKNANSLKNFLKVYNNYNEIMLLNKARNYDEVNNNFKKIVDELKKLEKEIENSKKLKNDKDERFKKVTTQIEIDEVTKKELDNQDLKNKVEELKTIEENINNIEDKIKELSNKIVNFNNSYKDVNNKIIEKDREISKLESEIDDLLISIKDYANDAYFKDINYFVSEIEKDKHNKIDFESIFMSIKSYKEKINNLLELLNNEEKILLESNKNRSDLENLKNKYANLEKDLNNSEEKLKESVMAWEEDFLNKLKNNSHLYIDDECKKEIFTLMNDYSNTNYQKANGLYLDNAYKQINSLNTDNIKLNNKLDKIVNDINDLTKEYNDTLNKEDLEIPIKNVNSAKLLDDNNIKYTNLYKVLEFKDNIKEEEKNKIESTLLDLNILDAYIINEKDIGKIKSLNIQIIYLTKTTKKKDNLLKYFDIVEIDGIDKNYIKDILESISTTNSDNVYISGDGTSRLDFISSLTDNDYKQEYIGILKRKEKRDNYLKELQNKIDVWEKEKENISNIINSNNHKIDIIQSEMGNFPNNNLIENIVNEIKEINLSISWNDTKQKELMLVIEKANEELSIVKDKINKQKVGINAPVNVSSINSVSKYLNNLINEVNNLKNTYNYYLMAIDSYDSFKERLEEIDNNISYYKASLDENKHNLEVLNSKKDTINRLLNTDEYKEQKEKLLKIETELKELSLEKETLIKEIATLEKELIYQEKELDNIKIEKDKKEKEVNIYKNIFIREYKLNFVYDTDIVDIDNTIKNIIKNNISRKEINISNTINNLFESYNHYKLELNDYSLKNDYLFNDYDEVEDEYKKLYEDSVRSNITALYQGVRISIIELAKKIDNDILENKDLISVQDRHLFEDILLNTVGSKIRDKIASSNEWVNKINNIMSKMQENSALSFKLVWQSIAAENDMEVDTKELVRILKMDPLLLKPDDTNKLTNHFRSKIKQAEYLAQDSFVSFNKIIEEILDYRTWFTFKLLYQRKGMNQKELTDKVFSKFSGGERAKSMYIPLFASVYAKLIAAKKDSLRIIALDEAFAGVDEDNIREMFGILNYLDLDFIINSQQLWGDYDTVSNLSICELVRPNNSQVVSVERYRWNGEYKEIINREEEINKELENEGLYDIF